MYTNLRNLLIGSPLPTSTTGERRLDKVRALASLSPDALASIAYANQEIFLGLVIAGAAGLAHSINLALVISGLLVLLTLSYRQTIAAYPTGAAPTPWRARTWASCRGWWRPRRCSSTTC